MMPAPVPLAKTVVKVPRIAQWPGVGEEESERERERETRALSEEDAASEATEDEYEKSMRVLKAQWAAELHWELERRTAAGESSDDELKTQW